MWKSWLDSFLKKLDNIETMSYSKNTSWSLSWLCNIEQIVKKSLVVVTTEKIETLNDKDQSTTFLS